MSKANQIQVGGTHYKKGGEEHWDRVWRLYGRGYFVGCITKYVERYHEKNGVQDLEKAIHFIQKLIELETPSPVQYDLPPKTKHNVNSVKTFRVGEVTPTGWMQFIFEGGDKQGALFTCRSCKLKFYAPFNQNPHDYHGCHDLPDDVRHTWLEWSRCLEEGDATPAYVNQE